MASACMRMGLGAPSARAAPSGNTSAHMLRSPAAAPSSSKRVPASLSSKAHEERAAAPIRARSVRVRASGGEEESIRSYEEGKSYMSMSTEALSEKVDWMRQLPRSSMGQAFDLEPDEDSRTMPLFPLGVAYLPGSEQVLNIFEPRYRAMYNDILFNGSRQFCVCMSNQFDNRFSEVAVVFYLDDLKEVSEQTGDRIKFICSHKVVGRVRMKKVLNPEAWFDRSTYLKVQVEDMPDTDLEDDCLEETMKLVEAFESVMSMQVDLGLEPRFADELRGKLDLARGEDSGLWNTVSLWQEFSHQRLVSIQKSAQQQIQELLLPYIQKSERTASGQYVVNFDNLPADIKTQLQAIQDNNNEEMQQLMTDPYLPFQLLLQEQSHGGRLTMLTDMVVEEQKRLQARVALKSLFSDS